MTSIEEALAQADRLERVGYKVDATHEAVVVLAKACRELQDELADIKKLDAIHVQDQYPLLQRALKAEAELLAERKSNQSVRDRFIQEAVSRTWDDAQRWLVEIYELDAARKMLMMLQERKDKAAEARRIK